VILLLLAVPAILFYPFIKAFPVALGMGIFVRRCCFKVRFYSNL
jgi:hypothetical protein